MRTGFELVSKRNGHSINLAPSWYGDESYNANESVETVINIFAVNLLNAELRLKRCERKDSSGFDGIDSYENDFHALSWMVPNLIQYASSIEGLSSKTKLLIMLQARCHWLASGYYLWWSHMSHCLSDVRQSESIAMQHIEKAAEWLLKPLSNPVSFILTPHLESPGRSGAHWKKISQMSLMSFRNEIQVAAVVSKARLNFQELQIQVQGRSEGKVPLAELTKQEKRKLTEIGIELLERYDIRYEGVGGKHDELLDDFLDFHTKDIENMNTDVSSSPASRDENPVGPASGRNVLETPKYKWGCLSESFSSTAAALSILLKSSDVCLLTILAVSLQAEDNYRPSFTLLLIRVTSACLSRHRLMAIEQKSNELHPKQTLLSNNSDINSESDIDADSSSSSSSVPKGNKASVLINAVKFFLETIMSMVPKESPVNFVSDIVTGDDMASLVYSSLVASAGIYGSTFDVKPVDLRKPLPDLSLFSTAFSLASKLIIGLEDGSEIRHDLESSLFTGLMRLIVSHRRYFPSLLRSKGDNRQGRTERQSFCIAHANFVAVVLSEMSLMLSMSQSRLTEDNKLADSRLIKYAVSSEIEGDCTGENSTDLSLLVQLSESLLWFWKYIGNAEVVTVRSSVTTSDFRGGQLTANSLDRMVGKQLVVPVAAAIISLSGSVGHDKSRAISQGLYFSPLFEEMGSNGDPFSFSDFFDSDDSANVCFEGDSDEDKESSGLLRMLVQCVQCCSIVFGSIDDVTACSSPSFLSFPTKHGPLLPLIAVRTLCHLADMILFVFAAHNEDVEKCGVWAEDFPFGARSAGAQLDSLLYKAYHCLHGFILVGQNYQGSKTKDLVCPPAMVPSATDSAKFKYHKPESTKAAAQLYRCIRRTYAKGRRSPPKAALECVASSLPIPKETKQGEAIRKFVFSSNRTDQDCLSEDADAALLDKSHKAGLLPEFPQWVLESKAEEKSDNETGDSQIDDTSQKSHSEVLLVRKGICRQLAEGPLPRHGATTSLPGQGEDSNKATNETAEREGSALHEKELNKKFQAILDHLCFEPTNSDGWHRAGICLSFKAELIRDRLIPLTEPYKESIFFVPPASSTSSDVQISPRFSFGELVKHQQEVYKTNKEHWVPFLGNDLSVYMRYPWSTFSTLQLCSNEIGQLHIDSDRSQDGEQTSADESLWNTIESKYTTGDFVGWEKAWGGIFVSALQIMSKRCFLLALYFSEIKAGEDPAYDIAESIGTCYYSDLMGDACYGYPMQRLPVLSKRMLAKEAKAYFMEALKLAVPKKTGSLPEENTWEQHFMIGKCNEKIARTFHSEEFSKIGQHPTVDGPFTCRGYEHWMTKALTRWGRYCNLLYFLFSSSMAIFNHNLPLILTFISLQSFFISPFQILAIVMPPP